MNEYISDNFGRFLRARRNAVSWSQKDLAEKIGVHPTVVWKWENQQRYPTLQNWGKIASAFNFDAATFLHKLKNYKDDK